MACGKALDGEGRRDLQKAFDAGFGGGSVPGGEVRRRKEPGSPTTDVGLAAHGDERVASIEGVVAFIDEAEVAGGVAGGGDAAEGAVEFAVGEEMGGGCGGAGQAALDLAVGRLHQFGGIEGEVLFRRFGKEAGFALADGDLRRRADGTAEMLGRVLTERVERADVVAVGVGEEDATDGAGIE